MRPTLCYWLCATPRTGSTALCNALAQTGVAGKPSEYFERQNRERALSHFGAATFTELLARVMQQTTTANGVFAFKSTGAAGFLDDLLDHFPQISPEVALDNTFPDLRLVFLTRRNKVRQAVSHWRAITSDLWHLGTNDQPAAPPADAYRFEAIDSLIHDIVMREAAWQQLFDQLRALPLTLAYEDFAANPEALTRQVLDYLGLESPAGWRLTELPHRPIADRLSENWVQRYRAERQAGWDRPIWQVERVRGSNADF